MQYLAAVNEKPIDREIDWPSFIDETTSRLPWMPVSGHHYGLSVREFVGRMYPKLSAWLIAKDCDAARLRCADQLPKLKAKAKADKVSAEDRKEMRAAGSDYRTAMSSYGISRDAFKTNQRSAWNVCKG